MKANKKILLIIIVILICTLVGLNYFLYKEEEIDTVSNQNKKQELIVEMDSYTGGTIIGDGYEISFSESDDLFYIKISKEPLSTYAEFALLRMEEAGLDSCTINYLVFPAKGISGEEIKSPKACIK